MPHRGGGGRGKGGEKRRSRGTLGTQNTTRSHAEARVPDERGEMVKELRVPGMRRHRRRH